MASYKQHTNLGKRVAGCVVSAGWRDEGIGWYSDDEKQVMLYRQYNPYAQTGTHNYTTSKSENDNLDKVGWNAEGTAWYGVEHATHSWVTVNHPAVTHEVHNWGSCPLNGKWVRSEIWCLKHNTPHVTKEYRDAHPEQIGWCSSDPNCLASCTSYEIYEVTDQEAYLEIYCKECGTSK